MTTTNEPPFNSGELRDVGPVLYVARVQAVYAAAAAVVDEWGDGDDVDPDRMDTVIARLAEALGNE
jgi:hypothetical protein